MRPDGGVADGGNAALDGGDAGSLDAGDGGSSTGCARPERWTWFEVRQEGSAMFLEVCNPSELYYEPCGDALKQEVWDGPEPIGSEYVDLEDHRPPPGEPYYLDGTYVENEERECTVECVKFNATQYVGEAVRYVDVGYRPA